MLKITLNGTPLNIPPDLQLNLIFENPLLFNDRIPSSHSLSFDLPATAHNLRIFGNPNRLNSTVAFREYNGLDIFFDAQKILSGVLVVQKFDKAIQCFFRGSVITDAMRLPVYQVPLTKFSFGNGLGSTIPPNFYDSGYWGSDYREMIWSSIFTDPELSTSPFVCPPMRIKDAQWPFQTNPDAIPQSYGNAATNRLYFNFWNAVNEQYMLFDALNPVHTVCFPFPYLHAVIDAFFAGQVDQNPFAEGDLSRIVLTSTYHPRWMEMLLQLRRGILLDTYAEDVGETDNYFYLNSFLGSIPANELIREALKLISATLYPTGTGFNIKANTDIIRSTDLVDWNAKLIKQLAIYRKEGQSYDFGYTEGEVTNLEEIEGMEVATIKDMVDTPVGSEGELNFYVTSTREYYTKKLKNKADPGDPDRFSYELISSAIGRKKTTENQQSGYNMASSLQPIKMTVDQYWFEDTAEPGQKIQFGDWYVPVWEGNRLERPSMPQIGLYLGVRETFSNLPGAITSPYNLYPLLSPHNVDGWGNKVGNLSLEWEGENGFLNKYHLPFKHWIEQDKVAVSGDFVLSSRDLRQLDLSRKVHLRGKNFFIEKLSVTIRRNKIEPAQVDLIEADVAGLPGSGSRSGGGI